jgi:hypothetical protein
VAVLIPAAESAHLSAFLAVLVFGVVVGVFGHIIKSRWLILTGLVIIGGASAYFSFVLQPTGN